MPELPEVEVSRMGISPHLIGQTIQSITFRTPKLRWDIPQELKQIEGEVILTISRRAKYLIIETDIGSAIVHLGMSGSLRVLEADFEASKHDHVDLKLTNGKVLRYNDPRRFGCWLWMKKGESHSVLENIGPEPLTDEFSSAYMFEKAKGKRVTVKQFIMDNKNVVGVGNIYVCESLFSANIHPTRLAGKVLKREWDVLVPEIKQVLAKAIKQGGTTLKDFAQADGKPGYFTQELNVYGRAGKRCSICGKKIEEQKISQRNTFFCSNCQR
ncbi:bifunctional DNA-formamidopyrimidine glycosylase/DNA-(apurinic or apyrimidinic site) lyase [Vibrio kyushuensis]|uniref:bifunctional DNA-formamidopyrimidine glycosylase/DNA-(apurinic or apyrimidinic site) lyase n=1 Tax=Vibrio kyushuensis TaxID=2910249 RepID=UPI003D0B16CB